MCVYAFSGSTSAIPCPAGTFCQPGTYVLPAHNGVCMCESVMRACMYVHAYVHVYVYVYVYMYAYVVCVNPVFRCKMRCSLALKCTHVQQLHLFFFMGVLMVSSLCA
jgi:hypothetical protein